ncbi:hypothetical protein BLNAU_21934 [Blattamonas nauphoetae]|uniref:Uncharacterized protein n=1 Tax=Blattamonas nauphoetae TaxID=2049346 RepID=A0ABQ9WUZ8_9EUKA|nr:hypothetical protein BLNAU_21934 [Blattamonas nauphoetae]
MPEDEPVDSNCMSKCCLHSMPICVAEFQDCYFDCQDESVKPSLSRLSDAKLQSQAINRPKEGKEEESECLSARMVRLNDSEKARKEAKQQGEELQKKAEAIK